MSAEQEKRKRKRAGEVSAAAQRGEAEFSRFVIEQMQARAERRAASRKRDRKIVALLALAAIAAALALVLL